MSPTIFDVRVRQSGEMSQMHFHVLILISVVLELIDIFDFDFGL